MKNNIARDACFYLARTRQPRDDIQVIPEELRLFAFQITREDLPDYLRNSYCDVLKQLSYDSSVDCIFPFEIVDRCLEVAELALLGAATLSKIHDLTNLLEYFNPEMSALIRSSMLFHGAPTTDIFVMVRFCCNISKTIHAVDVKPDEPLPIVGSYNPPRDGRAYYFTPHGRQLRKMRSFPIDVEKESSVPSTTCTKKYPVVGKKGTSYLFLWFCPLHGHCYGYHMIPFSEGRKDPSASLYLFKENAPDIIMYDFSCKLDEYTRNRESGFYRSTRFFHDIFHGYTHKCGSTFRSDRLKGLNVINSSICEQFNSFLQCVKKSAKLMSQVHFNFYVQFFIHVWNMKKEESFKVKLDIASNVER